ncbi:hypothetical protein Tco_1421214 [Tanacetum coccineum]
MNDDDEETDSYRTELDRIKILVFNQSSDEYYEEEEEKIDDEEMIDEEEDNKVTKEPYDYVNQVEEDAHVTLTLVLDIQKADEPVQTSSVSFDFIRKLLNLENPFLADNEISSLMETSARHARQFLKLHPVSFTKTFFKKFLHTHMFFNPLQQQATPTLTPTTFEATTLFTSLLDFSSVFKFNERVTNLEKDLSEIKQVDQYAQSNVLMLLEFHVENTYRIMGISSPK